MTRMKKTVANLPENKIITLLNIKDSTDFLQLLSLHDNKDFIFDYNEIYQKIISSSKSILAVFSFHLSLEEEIFNENKTSKNIDLIKTNSSFPIQMLFSLSSIYKVPCFVFPILKHGEEFLFQDKKQQQCNKKVYFFALKGENAFLEIKKKVKNLINYF